MEKSRNTQTEEKRIIMNRTTAFAIALTSLLLTASGAFADTYGPRDETQAPRGQDQQAPRGQDQQAPRGQDQQAPRGEDQQAPRA
jgi:hypothetical protein